MFVAAVLAFACGIYLDVTHSPPLRYIIPFLFVLLALLPFFISRKGVVAILLILAGFLCAGIVRMGLVAVERDPVPITEAEDLYEGVVLEASPNTKILSLTRPEKSDGLKVIFRTPHNLSINDTVRMFGKMKELTVTFKNPHVTSWKWLKGLEGVSYEIRGSLLSVTRGKHYIHGFRKMLAQKIESSGTRYGEIIKALTIGDTTGLDEDTKTLFLQTGTSHVLAISGSNIGIVTAFFFFIARWLIRRVRILRLRGDDIRYAALITIPIAFLFMLVAGSGIPTIRATIMITVYMLALYIERGRNIINTIAFSGLVILLIFPHSLFSPSFQLTFASVVFIIVFAQKVYPRLRVQNHIVNWLILSISMTVSATIGTLPIVLYHFYGLNPFSVIHNLVAVPLLCILAMPLSLVGLAIPFGDKLLPIAGEIIGLAVGILKVLNIGWIYPIVRPNLFEITCYFLAILILMQVRKKFIPALVACFIIPVFAVYGYVTYEQRFHNSLRVNFFDVGNGDAILVEGPKGMRLLIDGGGLYGSDYDIGKSIITPILLSRKIRTLDYVINTHPHGDHIGGLPYIIEHFNVRNFVSSAYFLQEGKFIDVMKLIRQKGIPVETWKRGDRFALATGFELSVLNPLPDLSLENLNNTSLALRVAWADKSFLFGGDIDSSIEEELVRSGIPLQSQILKIPHHGSTNSSSPAFLAAVKPDLAVLSVGTSIKGLPSQETLERYERMAIPVLRTDNHGFISISADRQGIATYEVFHKEHQTLLHLR